MKAIVLAAPGRLEMRDVPLPEPRAGQVRVRTAACGICATDLVMIAGAPRVRCPAVLGHEWSGVVEAVGPGVDAALVGRPCVAENVLADGGEVGFEHPGGYGEFVVTEAKNLHALPDGFDMAAATLIEPLAVCVRGMRRLNLADKRSALVLGDGPVGLLALALLVRAGVAHVLLVGGRRGRLTLARELGAWAVINYHEVAGDLAEGISRMAGRSFPNVIEASGSAAAMEAALELATPGGKVLVLGDYGDARAAFAWNRLLHRELELIGSNASAGAWPEAVRLATDPPSRRSPAAGEGPGLPLARLVSARYPAARFEEAVARVRDRRRDAVKVVLEWT